MNAPGLPSPHAARDVNIADDLTGVATALLARSRGLFDRAASALAVRCSANGKLDPQRLDAHQFASYELALASADLLAADTAIADSRGAEDGSGANFHAGSGSAYSPGAGADVGLDLRLALIFAVVAIRSTLARIDNLFLELDLDRSDVDSLSTSVEWAALRRAYGLGTALAAAGKAVAATAGDIGHVRLSEPLEMARDAFRRFAAEVVAPEAAAIHRHDLTVSEKLLAPMREMGVFGLGIPEQFGGSAPDDLSDALMMVVVTEALSEASLAAAGSLITRPEILARALLSGGTEAQKARWLPQIAVGDPLCAIAITEPDYGSDVASLALRATPVEGGWLLNGAKTWCTFAGKAGLLMVVARTGVDKSAGFRGLSVMLVEKPSYEGHEFEYTQESTNRTGGKLSGRAIRTIGYRGMHSFDLAFDDFFVPDDCVVGGAAGLGKGFYYTMAGMVGGRMQTAARALGVMRAALVAALRYASERKVFGAPLIDFQLTQVKVAEMASRFVACRKLAYSVARMLGSGDGRSISSEASMVKVLACRSAEMITREAQQIHGGMGYAEETAVSRYFVDARVLSIFEGAEETLALKVIARGLLERAIERAIENESADNASRRAGAYASPTPPQPLSG